AASWRSPRRSSTASCRGWTRTAAASTSSCTASAATISRTTPTMPTGSAASGRSTCGSSSRPESPRMPAIAIRPAQPGDVPLILRFIRELAAYELAGHEVVATEDALRDSLFGNGPARALVCSIDGVDAGFAVYFFNYSTWQGRKGLYLED